MAVWDCKHCRATISEARINTHMAFLGKTVARNCGKIDAFGLMRPTYKTFAVAKRARVLEKYLTGFTKESPEDYRMIIPNVVELSRLTIHASWSLVVPAEYFLAAFYMRLGQSDTNAQYNTFEVIKQIRPRRPVDRQAIIDRNARKLIHWIHSVAEFGDEMSAHELAALMGYVTHFVRVYNPAPHAKLILEALAE